MDKKLINEYVKKYDSSIVTYQAYYYGDNKIADSLCRLVVEGKKRATTSLYILYEAEKEPLPKVGDLSVILDSREIPRCITKITDVTIVKYKDISEEYAKIEGEGDKSLAYWKRAHSYFFTKECEQLGLKFNEDCLCVCEFFEVVYK